MSDSVHILWHDTYTPSPLPTPSPPHARVAAYPRSGFAPDASTMQVNTAKHYFDSHSSSAAPGEHRTAKLNLFHRLAMRSATLRRRDLLHTLQVRRTRTSSGPSRVAYRSHAVSASEYIVGGGDDAALTVATTRH